MGSRVRPEVGMAAARLAAVVFAVLEVGIFRSHEPPGYVVAAWGITAVAGVGSLLVLAFVLRAPRLPRPAAALMLLFDALVVSAFSIVYSHQYGSPTRYVLILVVIEGAFLYGLRGGIVVPLALSSVLVAAEWWRSEHFGPPGFSADRISFPLGVLLLSGILVGGLANQLRAETRHARSRALESEQLRDQLGRRADLLEAANRCSRALASSLDLDEAFTAFIRELRGLVPFDRIAITLAESGVAHVMATAGAGADAIFAPGSLWPLEDSVTGDVLEGRTVYQPDMRVDGRSDVDALVALGLRSRVAAPLVVGGRGIGMLSLTRAEVSAFGDDEIELLTLLGRLVGTAIQNIRAYDAERCTAEELRRLSALRADFVSLVSHELRSPMAAVIGAARTLQGRWRELSPEHREAFLALVADETSRLAALIADVLDTSRIEAGTFSFSFHDVDLGELVEDAVSTSSVGQDEVGVCAEVAAPLPRVRADRERLRQVLTNLIDNAVKYSETGGEVQVLAAQRNGSICVDVRDTGPGIPFDQQQLIFEKFGRGRSAGAVRPGTGLGLFIARSITEAHGGTLEVRSAPGHGSTFTLSLPLAEAD